MQLRHRVSRRVMAIAALTLVMIGATSQDALAMYKYRVWFYDDVFEIYEEGDITYGSAPLAVPPDWACGMWFKDPSYYRWVGEYGNTISSHDFSHDVDVWLSKGGCPGFSIEHGNNTLSPPSGAHYLEISTWYAGRWVDEEGKWPFCDGCAVATGFALTRLHIGGIDVSLSTFDTMTAALLVPRTRTGVAGSLSTLSRSIASLQSAVASDVSVRRRTALGPHEAVVRQLEDGALRAFAEARAQLELCAGAAAQQRFTDSHVACTVGRGGLASAQAQLSAIVEILERPGR
jgi:hypothetical protein